MTRKLIIKAIIISAVLLTCILLVNNTVAEYSDATVVTPKATTQKFVETKVIKEKDFKFEPIAPVPITKKEEDYDYFQTKTNLAYDGQTDETVGIFTAFNDNETEDETGNYVAEENEQDFDVTEECEQLDYVEESEYVPEETVYVEESEYVEEPTYTEEEQTSNNDDWVYYGQVHVTHYCHCALCNGVAGNNTASGEYPISGHTVAAGYDIPFYTQVMINGQVYVVEDRGVGEGCIDIFVDDHQLALELGEYWTDMWIKW